MLKCANCNKGYEDQDGLTTFLEIEDNFVKKSEDILVWDAFAYLYGISWLEFQKFNQRTKSELSTDSINSLTTSSIAICQLCAYFLIENYRAHRKFESSTDSMSIFQQVKTICRDISTSAVEDIKPSDSYCDISTPFPMENEYETDFGERQSPFIHQLPTNEDIKPEPLEHHNILKMDSPSDKILLKSADKCFNIEAKRKLTVKVEKLSADLSKCYSIFNKQDKINEVSTTISQPEDSSLKVTRHDVEYSKRKKHKMITVDGKRVRVRNTSEWRNEKRKYLKNSGEEYIAKNGKLCPGIQPCLGEKVCRCRKPGCLLTKERIDLCKGFWEPGSGNYTRQNKILLSLMNWSQPHERTMDEKMSRRYASYQYYLTNVEGEKLKCCTATFLDTFRISKKRLQVVQKRLVDGVLDANDKRGKHKNRPHKHLVENVILVNEHINSFPISKFNCCPESATTSVKGFLSPELNASKMFRLFLQQHGHGLEYLEKLYKDTLRGSGLHFPSSKCKKCLKIPTTDENSVLQSAN